MSDYTQYRLAKVTSIFFMVVGSLLSVIGFLSLALAGFDWTLYGKFVLDAVVWRSTIAIGLGVGFLAIYRAIVNWIDRNYF